MKGEKLHSTSSSSAPFFYVLCVYRFVIHTTLHTFKIGSRSWLGIYKFYNEKMHTPNMCSVKGCVKNLLIINKPN